MVSCRDLFGTPGFKDNELQIAVDEIFPSFACEKVSCSEFSPGPVTDAESIAFLLINPLHFDPERQTILPDAFQELFNRDLSVLRRLHARKQEAIETRKELIDRGKEFDPPKMRQVDQVCYANAANIRQAVNDNVRLFGIYDTALEKKPAHASVFTSKAVHTNRPLRKIARNRIHQLLAKQTMAFDELLSQLAD